MAVTITGVVSGSPAAKKRIHAGDRLAGGFFLADALIAAL